MGREGAAGRRPTDTPGGVDVAGLTRRAVADCGGVDPALLDGYLPMLAAVAADGRRLGRPELDGRRAVGAAAAERGVAFTRLVDLYLSATWLAWPQLPRPAGRNVDEVASVVLRAANDAVVALADGYESAQRSAIRHEEATRRELIDDLLHGTSDPARLPERAARFGVQLAGGHIVAVARAGAPFADGDEQTRRVEAALLARFGAHTVLIVTKEGDLVCVAPGTRPDVAAAFAEHTRTGPGGGARQVGVGRAHPGPAGVAQSYREARDVLDFAGRLGLATPVLRAADLLVFQVLFRDRAAITDLVATVLAPLQRYRSGARPLLDTLTAYYGCGNAVAAAGRLRIGVRTVTHRLQRIRELTGYDPTDPAQRLTLETAALGARLLDWPDQEEHPR